jgi:formate hydrogenlyase transcriptional activator
MKTAEYGPDRASLQALVDAVPALIHTARPDGFLDFFNRRWLEYVGLRLEDLEGWKWTVAIHPADVDAILGKWRACLASGEPFEFETRVRRADGVYRWMWHQKVPLRNTVGEIVKWYGSSVDIDDLKRAETELRRSDAYLAEAQRLSHTGSFGWKPDIGEIVWSDETYRMFECDRIEIPTLDLVLARVDPQDRTRVLQVIESASRSGADFDVEHRLVLPSGATRQVHVRAHALRDSSGTIEFVGAVTDISERKAAEEKLREQETELRQMLDLTPQLVGVYGSQRQRLFANRVMLDYLGVDLDTWRGRFKFGDALHPDDWAQTVGHFDQAVSAAAGFTAEARLRGRDGTYRWFQVRGIPVRDDQAQIIRWHVACADIDERKRAEQRLKEQEAEFRQMLDFTPQAIGVMGADGSPLYANRASLDYIGMSLDEWRQSRTLADFAHPDDLPRLVAEGNRAAGSAYELELRVRAGDGSFRWFLSRFNPLHDDNGQVKTWFIASTDIENRKRAEEKLQQENVALREEVDRASMFEEIIGSSPALAAVLSRVKKVAPSDSTVLVTGETGTGKELVARAIHRRSGRSARAFVSVNCAAIPRDLVASELFGHEKGAFTGAVQRRLGKFELADRGTIFLDEVGELSPDTQIALLRVLQEREFERVGGSHTIRVDVRVIAATNRDLNEAVANETFRADLFYRLNVFPIPVPPLRGRVDDIPVLVEYFIDRYARKAGKTISRVSKRALERLQAYPWPGNVRELQNVIERSVIVSDTDEFTVDESWLSMPGVERSHALSSTLAGHEKTMIEDALRASGGRVYGPSGAAARLGIARSTLESKILTLGIDKNRFRRRPSKP